MTFYWANAEGAKASSCAASQDVLGDICLMSWGGTSVHTNNFPLLFRNDCVHHNIEGLVLKRKHWSLRCLGKYFCCYCKLKVDEIAYRTDILVYWKIFITWITNFQKYYETS